MVPKPEAVTTSYDFAGKYPFPEITICAHPYNQWYQDLYPKPFNETVLKKCGFTWQEYQKNAQWVGNNVIYDPHDTVDKSTKSGADYKIEIP